MALNVFIFIYAFAQDRVENAGRHPHLGSMIEIDWGKPLHFTVATTGDKKVFSTIEQALYWLRVKWPVDDAPRRDAMTRIRNAMDCIGSVSAAKQAFVIAALTAGFHAPEPTDAALIS